MALLEQFFRLREPAWSGRVVTLGELAARCPASARVKKADAPAQLVSQNAVASPAVPVPAEKNGSSRPPRKTGDASVIAPISQPPPPPQEDARLHRRSGPCLEDPSLPPLRLRAQVSEASAEIRPLVLGHTPAISVDSPVTELRQITPPPVGVAPLQKPALGTSDATDAEGGVAAMDAVEVESSEDENIAEPSTPSTEMETEEAPPPAAPPGVRLEIVAEAGADVEALLAYLRELPGVTEARLVAQLSQNAAD